MLILLQESTLAKIVIATDSFKGTLSANEACEIIAKAIAECAPAAQLVIKPDATRTRNLRIENTPFFWPRFL